MVDFDKNIVAALTTILPCYYENFVTDDITLPCITYQPNGNQSMHEGDTQRYSQLSYMIKLWIDDKTQQSYMGTIERTMKSLGFVMSGYTEIPNGRVIQIACNFEAIGHEVFTEDNEEDNAEEETEGE